MSMVIYLFIFVGTRVRIQGLCTCKAGPLLLEPHLQYILFWLFWSWGLLNYLSRLALNHNLPDLSILSS
jgi:hypothetical protein